MSLPCTRLEAAVLPNQRGTWPVRAALAGLSGGVIGRKALLET
jgi:hypothetical protein